MARGETRYAHFVRCARTIAASQMLKRASTRAATSPALLSAAQCRCRRTPTHGFASGNKVFVDEYHGGGARWAVSGWGDLWGGEKRSSARGSPDPKGPDRREAMKRRRV